MAGESAEWREMADGILDSFGDVVKDATIVRQVQGAYNSSKGAFDQTETLIETRIVPSKRTREFIAEKGSVAKDFNAYLVRGSDFLNNPIESGDYLRIGTTDHLVDSTEDKSAGTSALFKIFVSAK